MTTQRDTIQKVSMGNRDLFVVELSVRPHGTGQTMAAWQRKVVRDLAVTYAKMFRMEAAKVAADCEVQVVAYAHDFFSGHSDLLSDVKFAETAFARTG